MEGVRTRLLVAFDQLSGVLLELGQGQFEGLLRKRGNTTCSSVVPLRYFVV